MLFVITRHGRSVAKLVPVDQDNGQTSKDAIAELRQLRKGNRLNGLSIRDLIDEGRTLLMFVIDASVALSWFFEDEKNTSCQSSVVSHQ